MVDCDQFLPVNSCDDAGASQAVLDPTFPSDSIGGVKKMDVLNGKPPISNKTCPAVHSLEKTLQHRLTATTKTWEATVYGGDYSEGPSL